MCIINMKKHINQILKQDSAVNFEINSRLINLNSNEINPNPNEINPSSSKPNQSVFSQRPKMTITKPIIYL